MESIIRLASIIRKKDYRRKGRTVQSLGLSYQALENLLSVAVGKSVSEHVKDGTTWYYVPAG
jgi:hypothetical protein